MSKIETQNCQIDYQHYRFGRARQLYRGPMPDVTRRYVSFIGGSETYGKFSVDAFPGLLGKKLNLSCANWGTPGAGPWFFLKDPVLLEALSRSRVCVISVMGAIPCSNRLYSVFKRRNARVRALSEPLKALFPDMDADGFRFASNMLRQMHGENKANFKLVEMEIQAAWVARMKELLSDIETHKMLVWFSARGPDEPSKQPFDEAPTFVTRKMFDEVATQADEVIEIVWPKQDHAAKCLDRVFFEDEEKAALVHPGASQHQFAADQLIKPLKATLKELARKAKAQ